MERKYVPSFCETERTPAQRLESVQWAFGVSASAGGAPSPELAQLYERYILGEIDLAGIRTEIERLYPKQPTTDPYPRYKPDLSGAPSPPYKPLPAGYVFAAEVLPEEPEPSAEDCLVLFRALVAEVRQHAAEMPRRQPYTRLDV